MRNLILQYKSTIAYLFFVVSINVMFSYLPSFSVMGGLISPVDFMVGFIFVFRDFAQREIGHGVLFLMLLAGLISYLLAEPIVALASITAFSIAETTDWLVFTWTEKPLYERLLISATVSAPLDSYVFLAIMGRFNWIEFLLISAVKVAGVLLLCQYWKLRKLKESALLSTV